MKTYTATPNKIFATFDGSGFHKFEYYRDLLSEFVRQRLSEKDDMLQPHTLVSFTISDVTVED